MLRFHDSSGDSPGKTRVLLADPAVSEPTDTPGTGAFDELAKHRVVVGAVPVRYGSCDSTSLHRTYLLRLLSREELEGWPISTWRL